MTHDSERTRASATTDVTAEHSRLGKPLAMFAYSVVVLLVVQFSRYPEWDESVFLSQSGGFEGIDSAPSSLVASRERGTPFLIGLLRLVTPSLSNTRLLWMLVSLAIFAGATLLVTRTLRVPGFVPMVLVGAYWLTFSFGSSFFSFFIAASVMLLATGLYFCVRLGSPREWLLGAALGLALAAVVWFRQVEGALFIGAVVAHSLVVTPRAFWSRRWRAVISAALTFGVAFVVPWTVDSVERFGSVAERIASGRGQSFERGFSSQFFEYLATLRGTSQTYGGIGTPPTWAVALLSLMLIGLFAIAIAGAVRRRAQHMTTDEVEVHVGPRRFLWGFGVAMLTFFMFFIGEVTDRYMVVGSMFVMVAASEAAFPLVDRWLRRAPDGTSSNVNRRRALMLLALAFLWVGTNAVIARTYEVARFTSGTAMERNVAVLRGLSMGESCHGVSRYGAPQVQFGSGCKVRSAGDPEGARRALSYGNPQDFAFVLWPEKAAHEVDGLLGPEARSITLRSFAGQQDLRLFYRLSEDSRPPDIGG